MLDSSFVNHRIFLTDDGKKNKLESEGSYYLNNKSYYPSSPPSYNEAVNGNVVNISTPINGNYIGMPPDDLSPVKNFVKEQFLNNINANTTSNGTNTTTIIAEIEGEVKKKSKNLDRTYYIAKEILMTELTYKKDLDVINVVCLINMVIFVP